MPAKDEKTHDLQSLRLILSQFETSLDDFKTLILAMEQHGIETLTVGYYTATVNAIKKIRSFVTDAENMVTDQLDKRGKLQAASNGKSPHKKKLPA